VISAPEVLHAVIDGLRQAGVKPRDIVVFDRNRSFIVRAGYDKWLPEGVRWAWASETYEPIQLDMDGYDADCYAELPVIQPGQSPNDRHFRRSYAAKFVTKEINKLINIPVLKHHHSAGVTLALKNMAYGMANNVARSHQNSTLHCTSVFIPAIVDLLPFRQKLFFTSSMASKVCTTADLPLDPSTSGNTRQSTLRQIRSRSTRLAGRRWTGSERRWGCRP